MKIFAYTKTQKFSKAVLDRLTKAGYIPISVNNLDCVRILEPMPDADSNLILNAALEAIKNTSNLDNVRTVFAKTLCTRMLQREAKENAITPRQD
jgi:hypothetical protein